MASNSPDLAGRSAIRPGVVLDGKYEILERIGAGGMGEVFKARHLHLNVFRCIKVMKQSLLADSGYRARFLREARLATQIHHPNVAVVHDFFVGEGGNYMVTEFIDGTTVRQWSAEHGPVPVALAADIACQVLDGLDHIHRRGLLHRDISPDNVMLHHDADGRLVAKIIDLGIAKDVNTASGETTQAGVLIGNPRYMSPEQLGLMGEDEAIDGRTDVYSVGVVLYEMLVGVPPFASETPHGYIMKRLTESPARFAEVNAAVNVPVAIEEVVLKALERDRARRYRDARELAAALAPFLTAPAGTLTREAFASFRKGGEAQFVTPTPSGQDDETLVSSTVARARVRIAAEEQAEFESARAAGRAALQQFIRKHPGGALARRARRLVRELAEADEFRDAQRVDTPAAWRLYLTMHPSGAHAAEAQARLAALEEAAFASARSSRQKSAGDQFLSDFPESTHRGELSRLMAEWDEIAKAAAAEASRATEPRDFDQAWESGTVEAWDRFLYEHPDSPRVAEARRCRQEAADFEGAVAADSAAMWRAFLKTWPEGRHRIDAAVRVRRGR